MICLLHKIYVKHMYIVIRKSIPSLSTIYIYRYSYAHWYIVRSFENLMDLTQLFASFVCKYAIANFPYVHVEQR